VIGKPFYQFPYVDKQSDIGRLYCAFKAIIIRLTNHSMGNKVSVEATKITLELKEVYIIKCKAYYVWNFSLIKRNVLKDILF
jgi:hypothetical protein